MFLKYIAHLNLIQSKAEYLSDILSCNNRSVAIADSSTGGWIISVLYNANRHLIRYAYIVPEIESVLLNVTERIKNTSIHLLQHHKTDYGFCTESIRQEDNINIYCAISQMHDTQFRSISIKVQENEIENSLHICSVILSWILSILNKQV